MTLISRDVSSSSPLLLSYLSWRSWRVISGHKPTVQLEIAPWSPVQPASQPDQQCRFSNVTQQSCTGAKLQRVPDVPGAKGGDQTEHGSVDPLYLRSSHLAAGDLVHRTALVRWKSSGTTAWPLQTDPCRRVVIQRSSWRWRADLHRWQDAGQTDQRDDGLTDQVVLQIIWHQRDPPAIKRRSRRSCRVAYFTWGTDDVTQSL